MLKSTYKPGPKTALPPLPPGWEEATAPTGHTYYYNQETKQSTYTRPTVAPPPPQPQAQFPNLSDPNAANAYIAQFNPQHHQQSQSSRGGYNQRGRGGHDGRPRPQPNDKPVRKESIPGHEPWVLVYTKYSRRFVYNPIKNTSYWRIPEKLMPGILELDRKRVEKKASGDNDDEADGNSSEYEEVEVTDDEEEGDAEHAPKRQRTDAGDKPDGDNEDEEEEIEEEVEEEEDEDEDDDQNRAMEFTEADIAAQLQAMGEDYDLEPGDYDDGNMEEWPEGAEGIDFSEEDAKLLFRDLLNDFNISPFTTWDTLLDQGKIVDDARYTALTTTKARKECWDEWSREKITKQKEERAKQEKKDPKIGYLAFLQDKASPKLYWPEFKRKYKREAAMKDMNLPDKDREKLYREHITRLKLPQATMKSDLTALLKAQPLHILHNQVSPTALPSPILADIRYITLAPAVRDPIIEAYIQTLPAPPEDLQSAKEESEEKLKEKELKERRTKALEERNRVVEEGRRKRERDVRMGKERMRDAEREVEDAMRVGKGGLRGQLEGMDISHAE